MEKILTACIFIIGCMIQSYTCSTVAVDENVKVTPTVETKKDVPTIDVTTETPIVPIMVEVPTVPPPKQDTDGTSIQTLQYVAAVVRHGDRYKDQSEFFENDPMINEDPFWMPHGFGQLRNKGKYRMHYLGEYLRQRYNGFIKEEYFYSNIKFYSAESDRCLMSSILISQGLYPPKGVNIWNDNVGKFFQPIPIRAFDPSQDIIFNEEKECPPYNKELKRVLNQELADINERYKDIYEYVSYHTGNNITNLQDINMIYQSLRVENENGRKLQDWTTSVFPSKLKALAGLYNQIMLHTDKMKRLRAGPILKELLDDLASKTTHLVDRRLKMTVWTGYDSTILKLVHTLQFNTTFDVDKVEKKMLEYVDPLTPGVQIPTDEIWETDYGASLLFELHYINMTYFVKVLYLNSGFSRTPRTLKFKECGGDVLCPYKKFNDLYQNFAISVNDWNKKCGVVTC